MFCIAVCVQLWIYCANQQIAINVHLVKYVSYILSSCYFVMHIQIDIYGVNLCEHHPFVNYVLDFPSLPLGLDDIPDIVLHLTSIVLMVVCKLNWRPWQPVICMLIMRFGERAHGADKMAVPCLMAHYKSS